MTRFDVQVLLKEMYEHHYGFYDHVQNRDNPFSVVSYHESEHIDTGGVMYSICREYLDYEVKKYYDLSLVEYGNMLQEDRNMLLKAMKDHVNAKSPPKNKDPLGLLN